MDWLSFLADVSIRSLALAAAAMLAIAVVRARSASVKHAVWTAVVCAMLALPLLSAALPSIALRVLEPAARVVEAQSSVPAAHAPAPAVREPAAEPAPSVPAWPAAAASAYLLIAAALLAKLALGVLLTRRMVKRSTPVDCASLAMPGIALAESNAVAVPLTTGWLRPRILLPGGWSEWERAKLDAVLAHEAAHVARRDWPVAVLARLNTCLFWFHPLSWWMERKLTALAEEACDESSLLATGDREGYAQVLLEMAQAVRASGGRLAWHAVSMARCSQVSRRIEAILDESRRLSRGMTKAGWAAVLLSAVPLVYGAAALRFEPAEAPAQAAEAAAQTASLSRGSRITPAEAERLEAYLQANPEDLTTRDTLISYYSLKGMREPRLKHIFWLIEHHPESEIAAEALSHGGPLNTRADYARARDLWLEQAREHDNDWRVLANSADFIVVSGGDLGTAADLLKRAMPLDPAGRATERLGWLYADVIVGALRSQAPRLAGLPDEPALAERFKAELEAATDRYLLANAGSRIAYWTRNDASGELAPVAEFGRRLMERTGGGVAVKGFPTEGVARDLQGGIRVRETAPHPGAEVSVVPSGDPKPKALVQVAPAYPPLARQARIQDTVILKAVIGEDGRVRNLTLVSGHPLLVPAAMDALKQWEFKPAESGGRPVSSNATFEINFKLPDGGAAGGVVGGVTHGVEGGIPGGIVAPSSGPRPQLIRRVEPVYPPLARQARIQGTVILQAVVGEDGKATDITAVSGPPLLVPAAIDALRQWEFKPAESGGRPVSSRYTVEMRFAVLGASAESRIVSAAPPSTGPRPIRIAGAIQAPNLVSKVEPVYPPLALQTRASGNVRLDVTIGLDGRSTNITLVSGPPLLVNAAMEAVRQWLWKPTLLNGNPVEVIVPVDVPFTLPQ